MTDMRGLGPPDIDSGLLQQLASPTTDLSAQCSIGITQAAATTQVARSRPIVVEVQGRFDVTMIAGGAGGRRAGGSKQPVAAPTLTLPDRSGLYFLATPTDSGDHG